MGNEDKIPLSELAGRVAMAKAQMPPGTRWQHYKGGKYLLMDYVVYEASGEIGVVYGPLDSPGVKFVRPLSVWQDMVEWEGIQVFRFRSLSAGI